jgi:hypothetical protein
MNMDEIREDYDLLKAALKLMHDTVVFTKTTIDYVQWIGRGDEGGTDRVEIYDVPYHKIQKMLQQVKTEHASITVLKEEVADLLNAWAQAEYSDEQWSWGSRVLETYREWPSWDEIKQEIEWL